jgi:biotin carboxylase
VISLLKMNTTIYNVETRVGKDGKPYIMEVSPRGGGNRLAEMVRYSTGADMITAAVRAAVGDEVVLNQNPLRGHWAEVIMHSDKSGKFWEIALDKNFHNNHVYQTDLWVKRGDMVEAFTGGNKAIGTLVLKFEDEQEVLWALSHQKEWLDVVVK